jgi:adenylosuccinate lyase
MSNQTITQPITQPITPLDTRYSKDVQDLVGVFDDFTYCDARLQVELEYFRMLTNIAIPDISLTTDGYRQICDIEATTRHDLKAIEYYIKSLPDIIQSGKSHMVHVGLTSQDANSLGFIIMFRNGVNILLGKIGYLVETIEKLSCQSDVPMLSFTHGQSAVPTNMKKELGVYHYRLTNQISVIKHLLGLVRCKIGGANGNNNALRFVDPDKNWVELFDNLAAKFGFLRSTITTQCDDYDTVCNVLRALQNCGQIMESLRMNLWNYTTRGYFKQANISGEVGSSTMSQKINPIDLENARTMLEMGSCEIDAICRIISILPYQRDISDSSATRCISSILGYYLVGIKRIITGMNRLTINRERIISELESNSIIVIEGVQTYLKYHCGIDDAYELTKELTRGRGSDFKMIELYNFIDNLDISDEHKAKLKNINVYNYC